MGIEVRTEGELELALEKASDEQRSELLLIEVHLERVLEWSC